MPSSQLRIQHPAPDFTGEAVTADGDFAKISLSDYKGKYLVFFFYPADFTFVCPTEIIAFSDRAEEFRAINCEVVGCSTDSHFSHLAWYAFTLSPAATKLGQGNIFTSVCQEFCRGGRGVYLSACWDTHTHTHTRPPPPPPGSRLQHTVNERPVRILLECILVLLL